jgi:hypothetical protein
MPVILLDFMTMTFMSPLCNDHISSDDIHHIPSHRPDLGLRSQTPLYMSHNFHTHSLSMATGYILGTAVCFQKSYDIDPNTTPKTCCDHTTPFLLRIKTAINSPPFFARTPLFINTIAFNLFRTIFIIRRIYLLKDCLIKGFF